MKDTARVLGRMFDGIEYRGDAQEKVETLGAYAGVPVWNGLTDDWHPTQMLADILTMRDHTAKPLTEVTYCYLGDGRNNTANSLLVTGCLLGMDVRICAPGPLQPAPGVQDHRPRPRRLLRRPDGRHRRRRGGRRGRGLPLHRRVGVHGGAGRGVGRPHRRAAAVPGERRGRWRPPGTPR